MKNLNNRQYILQTNADSKAMRVFVLLVFLLLSCSGVFGQNNPAGEQAEAITPSVEVAATDSQVELVNWFMGSKHISTAAGKSGSTGVFTKKQFINCGMVPNRILKQTLLKKAMNYENAMA